MRTIPLALTLALISSFASPVLADDGVGNRAGTPIQPGDVCIYDVQGGSTSFAMQCKRRDELVNVLEGMSATFGAISLCAFFAPEFFSKGVAVAAMVGGTASQTIGFIVKNQQCEGGDKFSPEQERQIRELLCEELGGVYFAEGEMGERNICVR